MQKTIQDLQKEIKKFMIDENLTQLKLAELLDVSQPAIQKKFKNFSWRYIDLVNLLDKLGYDVVWVKRDEQK